MVGAAKKAKSDAARKAASRAKMLEAGIVSVTVDFPERHRGWLREIAKSLVAGGDLPGSLVAPESLTANVETIEVPTPVAASIGSGELLVNATGHGFDGDKPSPKAPLFLWLILMLLGGTVGALVVAIKYPRLISAYGVCVDVPFVDDKSGDRLCRVR